MPYLIIKNQRRPENGGIRPAQGPEPSYWLNYFGTEDIDAGLAKVSELGGSQIDGSDRHRRREDRHRPGSAGSRVRALRGTVRRLSRDRNSADYCGFKRRGNTPISSY